MQNDPSRSSFEGGAFHPGFGKGKASGTIIVGAAGLEFICEGGGVLLPLDGLSVTAGGANNRLLFLKHPAFADWTIFTADHAILEYPGIAQHSELKVQRGAIQKQKWIGRGVIAGVLALLVASLVGIYAAKDPAIEAVARKIPPSMEEKLGDKAFTFLLAGKREITDPGLKRQLEELTRPLLAGVPTNRYTFKFHIIEDSTLNAFALPGGNVTLHSGLLLRAETPEEVAGVLAHELAHVTRQHGMRNLIQSIGLYAVVQAFFGDVTGIAAILLDNAPFLLTQKFSRDHEREADEQGWDYLVAANINPQGMISFFRRLEAEMKKTKLGEASEKLDFLMTHPATSERIQRLEAKWEKAPKKSGFTGFNLNWQEFQNSLRAQLNQKPDKEPKE